jgi:hypothetical protein
MLARFFPLLHLSFTFSAPFVMIIFHLKEQVVIEDCLLSEGNLLFQLITVTGVYSRITRQSSDDKARAGEQRLRVSLLPAPEPVYESKRG